MILLSNGIAAVAIIPLNANTFWTERNGVNNYYLGVSSFGMYHSQGVRRPGPSQGYRGPIDYRAEWRYSSSYAQNSNLNTGAFANYNQRREPFNCNYPTSGSRPGPVFYLGRDYSAQLQDLETVGRDTNLARLINQFGMQLHRQGIFRSANIARIWPVAANGNSPTAGSDWGLSRYRPQNQAFNTNFDVNGARVSNVQNADP